MVPARPNPFGPLALGVVFVAMMLTMAVSLARRSRQIAVDGLAAAAEQRFRRVNVLVLVLTGYAMAIMMSATTLESIPAFGDTLSGRVGFVLLPVMLFNFGVPTGCSASARAANAQCACGAAGGSRRRYTRPRVDIRGCSMSTRTTRQSGSRTVSALAIR